MIYYIATYIDMRVFRSVWRHWSVTHHCDHFCDMGTSGATTRVRNAHFHNLKTQREIWNFVPWHQTSERFHACLNDGQQCVIWSCQSLGRLSKLSPCQFIAWKSVRKTETALDRYRSCRSRVTSKRQNRRFVFTGAVNDSYSVNQANFRYAKLPNTGWSRVHEYIVLT